MALKGKLEKCWYKEKLMKQEQNRKHEEYHGLKGKFEYEKLNSLSLKYHLSSIYLLLLFMDKYSGIYILRNTMVVVGGGRWLLGKKMKTEWGGKKMKRKGKGEKETV